MNTTIFDLENARNPSEKISIDELFEKKRQKDLQQVNVFNKVLNRVHVRIKTASRQKVDNQFCWFLVPPTILGVPQYDQASCIVYLMDKLSHNGFHVQYVDPNVLFISWLHYVPSYVRTELQKKTGVQVDEFGNVVEAEDEDEDNGGGGGGGGGASSMSNRGRGSASSTGNNSGGGGGGRPKDKDYKPIHAYKPSGTFAYDDDMVHSLDTRLSKLIHRGGGSSSK